MTPLVQQGACSFSCNSWSGWPAAGHCKRGRLSLSLSATQISATFSVVKSCVPTFDTGCIMATMQPKACPPSQTESTCSSIWAERHSWAASVLALTGPRPRAAGCAPPSSCAPRRPRCSGALAVAQHWAHSHRCLAGLLLPTAAHEPAGSQKSYFLAASYQSAGWLLAAKAMAVELQVGGKSLVYRHDWLAGLLGPFHQNPQRPHTGNVSSCVGCNALYT